MSFGVNEKKMTMIIYIYNWNSAFKNEIILLQYILNIFV